MPAASAPALATWRTSPYSVYTEAWIHNPAIVFQAQVNMPTITYPVTQITYDNVTLGSYADLKPEMLVLVGSAVGLDDYGRLWIHSPYITDVLISGGIAVFPVADSSIIFVSRASQGTRDGEVNLADDAYITVLDLRLLRAAAPFIDATQDPDNPSTLKDGVIAFSSGDEFRPIVNIGGDRLKKVADSSSTASFDFDASGSIVTNPSAGSTKTYLWDVADGTITAGSTTTAAITVTFPYSAHGRYIQCVVTDDQDISEVGWRLVAVTYPSDPNLISQCTLKRRQPADGQEVSLQVDSPLSYLTWPDGTEVLIRQRERYGSTVGSLAGQADAEDMIFAGWIQSEPGTTGEMKKTGYRATTTLQLVDAAGKLKTLPGFPLVVERRNTALTTTDWEQMNTATMDRYAYHLEKWHSNLWSRCDFYWSGTGGTYPIPTLGSDGQSLWDQIKFVTNAIACLLTCDKNGRVWIVGDPNIQPSASQASAKSLPVQRTTTVIVDIGTGDWKNWKFDYQRPPRVHWNWGNAIVGSTLVPTDNVDIGTVFCIAPGATPGQGLDEQTSGQQLVNVSTPLYELEAREYNRYQARMNAYLGNIQFEIRPGDIGIDPALGQWVTLTIDTSTAAQRGRTLSGNFLPIEVQYDYDGQHGTCKSTLTVEQEVNSAFFAEIDLSHSLTSGVTFPPAPTPTPVPILPGAPFPVGSGTFNFALFDPANSAVLLGDSRGIPVLWQLVGLSGLSGWAGTLVEFIQNAFATSGGVVITTTTALQLLNVGLSPSLAHAHSFRFTALARSMQSERGDNGLFAVITFDDDASGGTHIIDVDVTTDGGVTWTNHAAVATLGSWSGGFINPNTPGCYVFASTAGKIMISGWSGSGVQTGKLFVSTDNGATWSAFDSQTFGLLAGDIHCPFQDESIVYHGGNVVVSGHREYRLYRHTIGSMVDISPSVSGTKFGVQQNARFSIKSCDVDKRSLLLVGQDVDLLGSIRYGVFLSRDEGATWAVLVTPSTTCPYRSGCFAGDSNMTIFLWGDAVFAVSYDGGVNFTDLSGNLGSLSVGQVVNIMGVS